MLAVVVLSCFLHAVSAQNFNSTLINNIRETHVISYEGVYYAVSATNETNSTYKYPLYTSTDLTKWEQVSYIFGEDNLPIWVAPLREFTAPQIVVLGEKNFLFYFTAINKFAQGYPAIGVAFASDIRGPYQPLTEPIYNHNSTWLFSPSIIKSGESLYMFYSEGEIYGKKLSENGLSLENEELFVLMGPTYGWEGGIIMPSHFMQRDGAFYLFYTAQLYCGEPQAIGVARSRSLLGVYEKMNVPLLATEGDARGPSQPKLVKDVDGFSDVLIYEIHTPQYDCNQRQLQAKLLAWDEKGWPIVTP